MKQSNRLTLYMSLLFLVVFVSFGVIIVKEKSSTILIPRVEEKLNNYLKETYPNITNEFIVKTPIYKDTKYTMKVISKDNKDLYFYIYYSNKKITDTYQEDYIKGKTLLNKLEKELENKIEKKTKEKISIKINTTLDNYSTKVKQLILDKKNIESLNIYTIETELDTDNWNELALYNVITKFNSEMKSNDFIPKNYIFIINDKSDITNTVKISNITPNQIEKTDLTLVFNDIINKTTTNVKQYKITYKYMN